MLGTQECVYCGLAYNHSGLLQGGSKNEEEEFNTGPLSVLMMSVKNNTQVSLYYCSTWSPGKASVNLWF